MVGCEQYDEISIDLLEFDVEPIHMTDVIHTDELNTTKAIVYRNMSKTNPRLGNHSYKHASIVDTNLALELSYMIGNLVNQILVHNKKVKDMESDRNTTKK